VAALMAQLPTYRAFAIADGVNNNTDREAWWAQRAQQAGMDPGNHFIYISSTLK